MLVLLLALACKPSSDIDDTEVPDDTDLVDTDVDTDPGDTDEPYVVDEELLAAIEDAAEDDLDASDAAGVQIAVWLDGEIVYQGQFGSAHPDRDVAITPETLFQVGSDTKKMTAIALLQQEDAGALTRETTVATALPGFSLTESPEWASEATLHHLISHQGGLYDYTPWDDDPADSVLRDRTYGEFADREWAHTPPGKTWNYANPNFSLAGLATEEAAGRPWADVLTDDLFVPLGMDRTYARKSEAMLEADVAVGDGYTGSSDDAYDPFFAGGSWETGTAELADVADNGWTRPAGLVWSTATDMANFGAFFIDGNDTVLDDALREQITTMQVRLYPAYPGYGYGYGMMVYEGINLNAGYHEMPVWAHGGNTLSYTSTTWILPEQRLSISILSNSYGDDFTMTAVTLMEGFGALPAPTTAPPIPSEETDHAALVGSYVDPYVGRIDITDLDGVLQIDMPDFEALGVTVKPAMRFEGLTDIYTFVAEGARYDIVFVADDDGTYRWTRNRLFVGARTEEALVAAGPMQVRRTGPELAIALAEGRSMLPLVIPGYQAPQP